ncbi:MAG: DUF1501 domain-containing protein [Burkholderiales bacterium]|nr:DUF1501 domain-containing protein [Burkholderiales bacterium]
MNTYDLHKDRRRFMKMMAVAAGTPMMGNLMQAAYAAGPYNDYRALVCVFLFGGSDAHNMIIPLGGEYAGYASGRGNLAIPAVNAIPVAAGVSGRSFGFHPSMPGLANIFNTDRKLAAIPNAGVLLQPTSLAAYRAQTNNPPQLFSHSDMQSHWQTGRADYPALTGWGGRMADLIESANGNSQVSVSISAAGQSLFQKGDSAVAYSISPWSSTKSAIVKRLRSYRDWDNYSLARPNPQAAFENQLNIVRANVLEDQWGDMGARALTTSEFVNSSLYNLDAAGAPAKDASGNVSEKFPITPAPPITFTNSSGLAQSNRLAGQLRSVANMIAARNTLGVKRQIFFVSLGGFDNHGDQFKNSNNVTTPILSGLHADLLKQLDQAMTWFYNWSVSQGISNNVTSFTMSDFGRTQTSNGAGSDHGWGTHCLALGGAVNGGAFYGGTAAGSEFPTVALLGPNDVGQGRLLPVTSVDEYGATFAKWMGASVSELPTVFPNLGRFARTGGMGFLA